MQREQLSHSYLWSIGFNQVELQPRVGSAQTAVIELRNPKRAGSVRKARGRQRIRSCNDITRTLVGRGSPINDVSSSTKRPAAESQAAAVLEHEREDEREDVGNLMTPA